MKIQYSLPTHSKLPSVPLSSQRREAAAREQQFDFSTPFRVLHTARLPRTRSASRQRTISQKRGALRRIGGAGALADSTKPRRLPAAPPARAQSPRRVSDIECQTPLSDNIQGVKHPYMRIYSDKHPELHDNVKSVKHLYMTI